MIVVLGTAVRPQPQALTPPGDAAAAERGQRLHGQECGFCHGANARGGSGGPDLTRSVLVQNDENGRQLGEFLQAGRPDRGMPKFDLPATQVADLAAFLHSAIYLNATNWPPPSFSPDTGLLYFGTRQTFSVMYLTDDTDGRPQGWAAAERNVGTIGNALKAIDYKTGTVKWSRPLAMGPAGSLGGAMGLLSTAGVCCLATTAAATSWPTTRQQASRCGTRDWAPTPPTDRKPIFSTAANSSSSARATRSTRSRCINRANAQNRVIG